jgi:predicted nucleic acid-binding protein
MQLLMRSIFGKHRQVRDGRVELALSEAILQDTARVLLTYPHIRERYHYPDSAVHAFCEGLAQVNRLLTDFPPLSGICRDPDDDMVLACAVAAGASSVPSLLGTPAFRPERKKRCCASSNCRKGVAADSRYRS